MALTTARVTDLHEVFSKLRATVVDVTFDASYPTGGEDVTDLQRAAMLRTEIAGVQVIGGNAASAGVICQYDTVNKKLLLLYPTGGGAASPAALADPAATAPAGAATTDLAAGAVTVIPGRGKELANATDASTLTYRMIVWGR